MRFDYRPPTNGVFVEKHWDYRDHHQYEELKQIPILHGRIQAVFGGEYLGYLIQIGNQIHAIARDGFRVTEGVELTPRQKNKAAQLLHEYRHIRVPDASKS